MSEREVTKTKLLKENPRTVGYEGLWHTHVQRRKYRPVGGNGHENLLAYISCLRNELNILLPSSLVVAPVGVKVNVGVRFKIKVRVEGED